MGPAGEVAGVDAAVAFTDDEIAEYSRLIEEIVWSRRRPPLHLRNKVREGQRIAGHEVELFMVRPAFQDPPLLIEEAIAKARYVRSRDIWLVFWQRADLRWHRYDPCPEVKTLEEFLEIVATDSCGCFWG